MPKPKKEIKELGQDEVKKATPEVVEEISDEKRKFLELIVAYKQQNPVKYALKEQEFLVKLNKL